LGFFVLPFFQKKQQNKSEGRDKNDDFSLMLKVLEAKDISPT